jgi:hypothetical protein
MASVERWLVEIIKGLCVNFVRHGLTANVRRFQMTPSFTTEAGCHLKAF